MVLSTNIFWGMNMCFIGLGKRKHRKQIEGTSTNRWYERHKYRSSIKADVLSVNFTNWWCVGHCLQTIAGWFTTLYIYRVNFWKFDSIRTPSRNQLKLSILRSATWQYQIWSSILFDTRTAKPVCCALQWQVAERTKATENTYNNNLYGFGAIISCIQKHWLYWWWYCPKNFKA